MIREWDANGNTIVAMTVPGNFRSRFAYDNAGRIASVVNEANEITYFGHDVRGHMTALTQDETRSGELRIDAAFATISTVIITADRDASSIYISGLRPN